MAFHQYPNFLSLENHLLKYVLELHFLPSLILLSFPQKYQNQRTLHCPETDGVSSLPEYAGTEDGWRSTNMRKDIRTADGWNQSA
jgi:hypothetical protein